MARLPQPELAFGVDVRGGVAEIAAEFRLGRDVIEPGHGLDAIIAAADTIEHAGAQ